jgi:hypothetical protein
LRTVLRRASTSIGLVRYPAAPAASRRSNWAGVASSLAPITPSLTPDLADLASRMPGKSVEVIVQLNAGTTRAGADPFVRDSAGA